MIRHCLDAGLPEPEFSLSDGFVVKVWRPKRGESQPESQPDSQPESLERRVLAILESGAKAKSTVSAKLGQKEVSGQLNKVIRLLLNQQFIEHTIPEKPNSRLQKHRITEAGLAWLKERNGGRSKS